MNLQYHPNVSEPIALRNLEPFPSANIAPKVKPEPIIAKGNPFAMSNRMTMQPPAFGGIEENL
jgi:hypothetical protein